MQQRPTERDKDTENSNNSNNNKTPTATMSTVGGCRLYSFRVCVHFPIILQYQQRMS